MREEFQEWVSTYPRDRAAGSKTKRGTHSDQAIMTAVPAALMAHIEYRQRFVPTGSTGQLDRTLMRCATAEGDAARPTHKLHASQGFMGGSGRGLLQ
jgi:hypothetical protein